jgi:putative flavoprotein involved in K+ transport
VDPPIEIGVEARRVTMLGPDLWQVETGDEVLETASVAICNGAMSAPHIPTAAARLGPDVRQIHSSQYRRPEQIETSRVLVVGSASSGVQIGRLLAESGRFDELSMSVSRVVTRPDRILGGQTHRFLHRLGLFDVRTRSLLGRVMYSGLEAKGDPIMRPAPKDLARMFGFRLFGRVTDVDGRSVVFADGSRLATEDLTIVWCTGLRGDYGFIEFDQPRRVFDDGGRPIHVRGVVDAAPGLFFVGLRYQHTTASHDIYGVGADARYIADRIADRRAALVQTYIGERP